MFVFSLLVIFYGLANPHLIGLNWFLNNDIPTHDLALLVLYELLVAISMTVL